MNWDHAYNLLGRVYNTLHRIQQPRPDFIKRTYGAVVERAPELLEALGKSHIFDESRSIEGSSDTWPKGLAVSLCVEILHKSNASAQFGLVAVLPRYGLRLHTN